MLKICALKASKNLSLRPVRNQRFMGEKYCRDLGGDFGHESMDWAPPRYSAKFFALSGTQVTANC
jgi:hypothetical protein